MGNSNIHTMASPPMDYRVTRTVRQFQLPASKVNELWQLFCQHDENGNGYMTKECFFKNVIQYNETCLTYPMFQLIESRNDVAISFGEFVEVVTTFACFGKNELLKYFFYLLDENHTGQIEKTELRHFIQNMWEGLAPANIIEGLKYLDRTDDGDNLFNFAQVCVMQDKYPFTFSPLYRLQMCIQRNTLGEYWWNKHKNALFDQHTERQEKEHKAFLIREKVLAESKEIITTDMIKHRMGFRYHLMPWRREKVKARMLRIIAIEDVIEETLRVRDEQKRKSMVLQG